MQIPIQFNYWGIAAWCECSKSKACYRGSVSSSSVYKHHSTSGFGRSQDEYDWTVSPFFKDQWRALCGRPVSIEWRARFSCQQVSIKLLHITTCSFEHSRQCKVPSSSNLFQFTRQLGIPRRSLQPWCKRWQFHTFCLGLASRTQTWSYNFSSKISDSRQLCALQIGSRLTRRMYDTAKSRAWFETHRRTARLGQPSSAEFHWTFTETSKFGLIWGISNSDRGN